MAGTVNLKSKISLDDSAFTAGIKRVSRATALVVKKASAAFRKVGASIGKAAARMKNFAMIAGALTFAAAIAGAYKLGRALKDAFDLGGRLSDLSAQTGVAVKDLAILQQAFEDNGVAGDDVGKVINRLQRSISDFGAGLSTQTRAFEKLGITFDQLKGKTPLMQFQMVQNAIAKIEDPTMKAAAAMEIFGRSGGDMLALFQDSGAIERASETMGSSADILQTNAEKFDRISDLLNRASVKFQGIILALAEVAAPKILAALEKFNAMDFAGIGRRFLAGLNMERAKELLLGAMKVAAAFLGNKLVEAMRFAAHLGEVAFTYIFDKITGDFGRNLAKATRAALFPTYEELENGISSAVDSGMSLDEQMVAAADSFKQKVKTDADPFGFQYAVKQFQKSLDGVMQSSSKKASSESDLYEKELEEQRARIKRDEEAAREAKNKATAEAARKQAQIAIMQAEAARMGATPLQVSQTATKMAESHKAGFSGLTGLYQMQMQKAQGIGVGETTRFAKDRRRLGIASGLQSGGIGSKRYINPAREAARIAKEQKKDNREQIEVLRDVDRKLGQGLLAQ